MRRPMTAIHHFCRSESGAVTVDWVVLTAALVGLGLAVMTVVRGGVQNVSGDIDTTLTDIDIEAFAAFGNGSGGTFSENGALALDDDERDFLLNFYSNFGPNSSEADNRAAYASVQATVAADPNDARAIDQLGIIEEGAAAKGFELDPGNGVSYNSARDEFLANNPDHTNPNV